MLARVWSAAVRGIDGYPVSVELDLANGLPSYTTVGLPDVAVKESRDRVVAAVRNSGYEYPCRRVTVNLAPAEFRKRGTQFDLPVALGLLTASGQLEAGEWMGRYCFMGELALDGSVKPVSGVLPMAAAARAHGMSALVLPRPNAAEAAATGLRSYGVRTLREAAALLSGLGEVAPAAAPPRAPGAEGVDDLSDVRGQTVAKRALEIAAAGGHNVLLFGPPGTGKSMLASRLPGLLPELGEEEALEVARIRSVVGLLPPGAWPSARPYRAPHHTMSQYALIGGGSPCRPGEVTLAHRGVLFLDELPEFSRECRESLRVPLETGRAVVSRLNDSVDFPARFMLAAAMNPCPCGYRGHPDRPCSCSPAEVRRYRQRISGPLWDRFDLRVEVAALPFSDWNAPAAGETSAVVRARVVRARGAQAKRLGRPGGVNATMTTRETRRYCRLDGAGEALLEGAAKRLALSGRGLNRIMKLARTIADLAESADLTADHVAEAVRLSGRGEDIKE